MNYQQKITHIKNEILNVIEDFAHASSLHGVKYMLKRNIAVKDRLMWSIAVFVCIIIAIGVGTYLWHRYRMFPTVIDVMDTHQPLYTFPFPTITVCSGTRIKRGVARDILSRFLPPDMPVKTKENVMLYLMSALSLLQYPNYNLIKPYLRTRESKLYLHEFMLLNITDFMLQFYCDVTMITDDFSPLSEVLENEGVVEEDDFSPPECQLRRNTGISTGSGLELYLRPSDPLDNIGYRAQRVVNGVSILIHSSYEFPHAGTGVYVPNLRGSEMSIAIAAEITMSSESIRTLAAEDRRCIFPDEEGLHIHHVYTRSSCLTECRMKYIMLMCRCKLYFFKMGDLQIPDCNIQHLSCISKNAEKFRFFRPPLGTPGVTDREMMDSLNCECYPTCYDTVYDLKLQRRIPEDLINQTRFAHVDMYYLKTGFVRYQRHIVFEFIDLVVSLGGVANLFLGFSLLSMVEAVYWMYRIVLVLLATRRVHKKITQVHPIDYFE